MRGAQPSRAPAAPDLPGLAASPPWRRGAVLPVPARRSSGQQAAAFDVPASATEESERGLGALSPGATQALVRARQWRHCYYTWPQSPFKALEDELCFIYIKEAISEPICDQICCQRNFALSHYI